MEGDLFLTDKKKAHEVYCISVCQEAYADFPPGQLKKDESPDFRIEQGESCIGLEGTQAHRDAIYQDVTPSRGSPQRGREQDEAWVLQKAHRQYLAQDKPPVYVTILWDRQSPREASVRRKRVRSLVGEIANLVAK